MQFLITQHHIAALVELVVAYALGAVPIVLALVPTGQVHAFLMLAVAES